MQPLLACLSFFCLGTSVSAGVPVVQRGAHLTGHRFEEGQAIGLGVHLRGGSGQAFEWQVRPASRSPEGHGPWLSLGVHPLDAQGQGHARIVLSEGAAPLLEHRARYLRGTQLALTPVISTGSSLEEPLGEDFDCDWGVGGVALPAGLVASDAQPWSDFLTVSAANADPAHRDAAILVDSARWSPTSSPAGGDRLGQVLTIAADVNDDDGDGLVDAPASEDAGGVLSFHFAGPTRATAITLFDIDEVGGELRSYSDDRLMGSMEIPSLEDLSVQTLFVPAGWGATRLEVELAGSGAVVGMVMIPCPAVLGFDESSTGVPLGTQAGQEVGGLYPGLGLFEGAIQGANHHPDHPDKVILFDSSRPSGDDTDLVTPGYGIGNDTPHRNVLILAEDDADLDGDGLVDIPDDEAAGGVISFTWFTSDVYFESATVLDIDVGETAFVRVFDDGLGDWRVVPFADLGDNSAQTVTSRIGPTRNIEFHFSGSGAVAELTVCSD